MQYWHHWLKSWLEAIDIPMPSSVPEDQFAVSTENDTQYVLENGGDHVLLSVRVPSTGYRASAGALAILKAIDPCNTSPFFVRVGYDGVRYCVLAIRIDVTGLSDQEQLIDAFELLWTLERKLTDPVLSNDSE